VRLKGKVVIITGAASGIGRASAKKFCEACDLNEELLKSLVDESKGLAGEVVVKKLSVTDREAIKNLVEELKEKYGKIDGLVNNAGITRDALIQKMSEEDWDAVVDVNLKGVFNMTQFVAPVMLQGRGYRHDQNLGQGIYQKRCKYSSKCCSPRIYKNTNDRKSSRKSH